MNDTLAQVRAIKKHMNMVVVDRKAETHSLFLTLLANTSCLLLGPRGTSKTGQIRLFTQMTGLSLFETLITSSTKPDQVFGPTDVPALAQGIQRIKTTGYAPTSDTLFLDEVFKANGLVLNPLLWLLNERIFRNGDLGVQHCPLLAIFAASNETPSDPELAPVYDRFVIRHHVNYLASNVHIQRMFAQALAAEKLVAPAPLTKEQVLDLRKQVTKVEVPFDVQNSLIKLRNQIKKAIGLEISDRRLVIALRVMQANALLAKRQAVVSADLSVVGSMFWDDPMHSAKVNSICMYTADAISGDIASYESAARSVYESALKTGQLSDAIDKLDKIMEITGKLTSAFGKRTHGSIQQLRGELHEMTDSRKLLLVLEINDPEGKWWKLVEASALLWSAEQMRSVGFHLKRNGGYWWQPAINKQALLKQVRIKLGAKVRFQSLY